MDNGHNVGVPVSTGILVLLCLSIPSPGSTVSRDHKAHFHVATLLLCWVSQIIVLMVPSHPSAGQRLSAAFAPDIICLPCGKFVRDLMLEGSKDHGMQMFMENHGTDVLCVEATESEKCGAPEVDIMTAMKCRTCFFDSILASSLWPAATKCEAKFHLPSRFVL